jgi:hypothetical protein
VALQGKLGFFPVTSTIFVRFTQFFNFNKVLFGDGGFFLELVPASAMLLV